MSRHLEYYIKVEIPAAFVEMYEKDPDKQIFQVIRPGQTDVPGD